MPATIKEKLEELNALRMLGGEPPLKSWKKTSADLDLALAEYNDEDGPTAHNPEMGLNEKLDALSDIIEAIDLSPEASLEEASVLDDPTSDDPEPTDTAETVTEEVEKAPRGAIGQLVMDLLMTEMPYGDMVVVVKAKYPSARTTTRSIASVAMDMRRAGEEIPSRRRVAKPKA